MLTYLYGYAMAFRLHMGRAQMKVYNILCETVNWLKNCESTNSDTPILKVRNMCVSETAKINLAHTFEREKEKTNDSLVRKMK